MEFEGRTSKIGVGFFHRMASVSRLIGHMAPISVPFGSPHSSLFNAVLVFLISPIPNLLVKGPESRDLSGTGPDCRHNGRDVKQVQL